MRIHVVGIGAVGNFVAFHLRRSLAARHSVVALHRIETANAIKELPTGPKLFVERDGTVVPQDGVIHMSYGEPRYRIRRSDFAPAAFVHKDDSSLREEVGHIDSLIITSKAYAAPAILNSLKRNISRDSTIVLLHNGMGVYEQIIEDLFPQPNDRPNFIFGVNTHGLYSRAPLHSVHTGVGRIRLGIAPDTFGRDFEATRKTAGMFWEARLSLDDIASPTEKDVSPRYLNLRNTIAALTRAPGLRATWEPLYNVLIAMRQKLVVNSFINPVSALLQCQNGATLNSVYGRTVADRVCREAEHVFMLQYESEVAEQRKIAGKNIYVKPFPRQLIAGVLRDEIERVVEHTSSNYSSMYWDIRFRRPTEIDFINGYLINMSKKHHYRPMTHLSLTHLIKMRMAIPLAPAAA
ncbi:hypothetical protein FKP32DRAFT_1674441 [Trametes sanguinea]|nr:hypothetical protein FKP32DRAFT_1674441 [Trametes sanguinea]